MIQAIQTQKHSKPRGFALVATLSLMVLLAILALGMLSLSSISLRASSRGDAQGQARANARLALTLAIGQLQREMGPDSRVSVPHDVGGQPGGMPRWVGVYDAWKTDPANPTVALTPGLRVPAFRSWLISGASGAVGTIPLVGAGSLGASAAPGDFVSAPMVALADPGRKGKIAWWTSDESVKAKVKAGPDSRTNPAFGLADAFFNAQSPPNLGHKAFAELATLEWKAGQRGSTVSTGSLNLAAGLGATGVGGAIHNLTVHSAGVFSDVREGRLKRDFSNLLSRPIAELENKPLYLANGRMNRFLITDDGAVSNAANIDTILATTPSNSTGINRRGINLEELYLFHNLHREIDWSTGKPQLVNKDSKEAMVDDRFYIYREPVIEALHIILSFRAVPDTATPGTYMMQAMLDGMMAVSNPNDIPTVWPASMVLSHDMHSLPYRVKWNILRANGTVKNSLLTSDLNVPFFKCNISGGFTLEPGEAAVFGNSLADTLSRQCNLTRGFAPRGGVAINDSEWGSGTATSGLRARSLVLDDRVSFAMNKTTGTNNTGSGWMKCTKSFRNATGSAYGAGVFGITGGGSTLDTPLMNQYMLKTINPPQTLPVQSFVDNPMPVMMITLMPNVEKSRTTLIPPNAYPSRAYHFFEPAVAERRIMPTTQDLTMQTNQLVTIAEPMDYEFANDRTLAAGVGGRNLYHGGAREVGLGGSFNVVKRRIPLSPPLSIGAFENAIACGFVQRGMAVSGSDPAVYVGSTLSGTGPNLPASINKAIGNSWSNPLLISSSVYTFPYYDTSWMVNNALWDSWFLSGIVDGRGAGSSPWMSDSRSPRAQFQEFAEGTGELRNKRFSYNPSKSVGEALDELFIGDDFKPGAISKLTKYLLADGAFNVNSTSDVAWKSFLTSVKEQELLDANGALQKMSHPFGTLGYACSAATSGTQGDWNGFRDLTDTEVDGLAKAIVLEVKARGPFLNMADFVNRRPDSPDAAHRALGALQAAIEKSGLNSRFKSAGRTLLPTDVAILAGKNTLADEPPSTSPTSAARAIGSAGYLSQAALLTAFGSQITVRGDTFVIRAYGDHRDAFDNILAQSWCEAVVQRTPDYVDSTDAPDATGTLTTANSAFGRKFNIISFRWLKPEEI